MSASGAQHVHRNQARHRHHPAFLRLLLECLVLNLTLPLLCKDPHGQEVFLISLISIHIAFHITQLDLADSSQVAKADSLRAHIPHIRIQGAPPSHTRRYRIFEVFEVFFAELLSAVFRRVEKSFVEAPDFLIRALLLHVPDLLFPFSPVDLVHLNTREVTHPPEEVPGLIMHVRESFLLVVEAALFELGEHIQCPYLVVKAVDEV